MKLSEILRAGKQRIETLGWVQGDEAVFQEHSIKCCAATAMCAVEWSYQQAGAACRFFERTNGIEIGGIADWNDAPERSKEDVLAAYDKAIAAAEAEIGRLQ